MHVGAIQGFNQITNGMRDARLYIEAFGAPLFVPTHHDDWAVGITTKGENYRAPLAQELARIPAERRPQVRFIADPTDYVRPEVLTFPVRLEPLRLTRRCAGGGRLRVRVAGDTADVAGVTFRLGRRERVDRAAPFEAVFPRSASRGRRVTASLVDAGRPRVLRRGRPSCGVSAG